MSDVDKIVFECKHCGTRIRVGVERMGRTIHCMQCRCAVRIPPASVPVKWDDAAGETMLGSVTFDTQVVEAIRDVEIITADGVRRSATLPLRSEKTPAAFGRIGVPIGTGMLTAACIVLALAIILRSASGPKRVVAQPADPQPPAATMPGK